MSSAVSSSAFDRGNVSTGLTAAEAGAGIAAIVLTILGLAHVAPGFLAGIATIAVGVALLAQGGTVAAEYARISGYQGDVAVFSGSSSWSIELLAGAAGIVLGILTLLGITPLVLAAAAIIAFGGGLCLSAGATAQVAVTNATGPSSDDRIRRFAVESASTSSITQALTGLQAVVLGILALAGLDSLPLALIALLVIGVFLLVNGSAFSGFVLSFFRR